MTDLNNSITPRIVLSLLVLISTCSAQATTSIEISDEVTGNSAMGRAIASTLHNNWAASFPAGIFSPDVFSGATGYSGTKLFSDPLGDAYQLDWQLGYIDDIGPGTPTSSTFINVNSGTVHIGQANAVQGGAPNPLSETRISTGYSTSGLNAVMLNLSSSLTDVHEFGFFVSDLESRPNNGTVGRVIVYDKLGGFLKDQPIVYTGTVLNGTHYTVTEPLGAPTGSTNNPRAKWGNKTTAFITIEATQAIGKVIIHTGDDDHTRLNTGATEQLGITSLLFPIRTLNLGSVSGRVFNDANVNATNDTAESSLGEISVVLYDTANNTCVSQHTNSNGDYLFDNITTGNYQVYLASLAAVPTPTNCGITFAENPVGYRATMANVSDVLTVTNNAIMDQDFGVVAMPTLSPNHQSQIVPNNVTLYAHRFSTPAQGTVQISRTSTGNISTGWSSVLYQDINCDGQLVQSEAVSPLNIVTSLNADELVCLINKVYAPANVSANDQYIQTITAFFDYQNAFAGTVSLAVIDITNSTTSGTGPSRLVLRKTVRNVTQNTTETDTMNNAIPADILEYRLYYRNSGTGPINDLIINDVVPAYTALTSNAHCGSVLSGMGCTASALMPDDSLSWTFTGILAGGASGFVSYQVKIDS